MRFSAIEKLPITPSSSRDSGINAIPACSESLILEPRISRPSKRTDPSMCSSKLISALASSDWPLPCTPATARTSPAFT